MGIEELNELKDWFVNLTENLLTSLGNGQYEPISPDNVRAILALIDDEEEKRNAREWERMVDAYGTLEGWLCPCGFSSAVAWNYCPSCGSEMYGGEKLMSALTPLERTWKLEENE